MQDTDSFETTVLTTPEEIVQWRPQLEELIDHPNAEIDHYLKVVEVRDQVMAPHVILILRHGRVAAFALGRLERERYSVGIGYRSMWRPHVRLLTVIYRGVHATCPASARSLAEHLLAARRALRLDALRVHSVPTMSLFHREAAEYLGKRLLGLAARPREHWTVDIREGLRGVLGRLKSKSRYNLRRELKRFDDRHNGRQELRRLTSLEEIAPFCTLADRVAAVTYQRGLGVGFRDDRLFRERIRLAAERGAWIGYLLLIDDEPASFALVFQRGTCAHLDSAAFDPRFENDNPGTVLLMKVIEHLSRDRAVDKLDFGFGDAFYKRRIGSTSWQEQTISVFAASPRGLSICAASAATRGIDSLLRFGVQRLGWLGRVKRRWRRALKPSTKAS